MRSLLLRPELYRQTISGNKTETRRLYGLDDINESPDSWELDKSGYFGECADHFFAAFWHDTRETRPIEVVRAKYRKGETLFLAEVHWIMKKEYGDCDKVPVYFTDTIADIRAEVADLFQLHYKKMSPLFLKEKHAREFIKITDISIQRVQDISQEGAIAEGMDSAPHRPATCGKAGFLNGSITRDCFICSYEVTWNRLNGEKGFGWLKNPWVWVYKYEYLVDKSRTVK